jgi:hypothetical protein
MSVRYVSEDQASGTIMPGCRPSHTSSFRDSEQVRHRGSAKTTRVEADHNMLKTSPCPHPNSDLPRCPWELPCSRSTSTQASRSSGSGGSLSGSLCPPGTGEGRLPTQLLGPVEVQAPHTGTVDQVLPGAYVPLTRHLRRFDRDVGLPRVTDVRAVNRLLRYRTEY